MSEHGVALAPPPRWLRLLVRVDFVAAVLLTVLAPLALLAEALARGRRGQTQALLGYWRVSSLLMVTVYLLAGERRAAFPAGVLARLLIARNLLNNALPAETGPGYVPWRRLAGGYCLAGAALTTPMLWGLTAEELPPICRAYAEPPGEFAALLHPRASAAQLGRAGELGLALFGLGALAQGALNVLRSLSTRSG